MIGTFNMEEERVVSFFKYKLHRNRNDNQSEESSHGPDIVHSRVACLLYPILITSFLWIPAKLSFIYNFVLPVLYLIHTHRNYEVIRQQEANSELSSKDINAMIARQWREADGQEKQAWQFKADQLKRGTAAAAAGPEVQDDMDLPTEGAGASRGNRKRKSPPKDVYV
jgi:hypothetical protein